MRYRNVDVELSDPIAAIDLDRDQSGIGLLVRWQGRLVGFSLEPLELGSAISTEALTLIIERRFTSALLRVRSEAFIAAGRPLARDHRPVTLSVAICTKDRAQRLRRLLSSLKAALSEGSPFATVEVIVVDNASVDDQTRDVVAEFPGFRWVREARTGLDFARNAAVHAAGGDLLAYLDDDVVIDRGWFRGLYAAWSDCPGSGGFSGLVLPFRLDTKAQISFEQLGGFGRGFERIHHREVKFDNPIFPAAAGNVGAGCNMAFDRKLLIELGGFDEALDTGAPLPGGGDLDIFYRVLRSGRGIVYEPQYAVFHEHRETMPQLRRQYWTWGLGFMAFLVKAWQTDVAMRPMHVATARWWFRFQVLRMLRYLRQGSLQYALFSFAELRGAVQGLAGEYGRSQRRSDRIRKAVDRAARHVA